MFEKEGRISNWYYLAIACLLTVLSFGVVVNDSMAAGPGGYALKFPEDPDPSNRVQDRDIQYVRINFGEDRLRYDARSVSLWFKTARGGHRCLVAYINSTGKITGPCIALHGGQIWVTDWWLQFGDWDAWGAYSDKLSFNDNKWHHLVHVFGKQRHTAEPEKNIVEHRVYVDGERLIFNCYIGMGGQPKFPQKGVDEFHGNSTIVNADAMTLGYTPFGKPCIYTDQRQSGWHFYDSFIDDVAVWETALTDEDVANLYDGASPSRDMLGPRGYLRGYWPFVRGSGETIEDVARISMSPPSSFLPPDEEHRIEWVRPMPEFESDSVSFGQIFLPSTCPGDPQYSGSQTLTIRNIGDATLRVLEVVREGPVLGHSNYADMDIEPGNSDVIELPFDYDAWVGAAAETTHGTYDETLTITTNQAEDDRTNDDYPKRVTEEVEVTDHIELYFDVLSPSKLEHVSPEKQDGQVHVAFGDTVEFKVGYTQCYENEEIERLEYKLVEQGGEVVIDGIETEIDDKNLPLLDFEISFTKDKGFVEPDEYSEYNLEVIIINDLGCPTDPDKYTEKYTEIRVWKRPGKPQAVHDPDNVDWYDSGGYFFGEKGKDVRLRAEVHPGELHGNTIENYEWEMVGSEGTLFTAAPGSVKSFVFDDNNIKLSDDGNIWLRCTAISEYGIRSEPSDFELRLYPNLQVDAGGPYKGIPGRDVELQAAIINADEYGKGFQQEYQWKVSDEPGIRFSEGVLVRIDKFPVSPATTEMSIAFWMKSTPQDGTLADWSVDGISVFSMEMVDSNIVINSILIDETLEIKDLSVDDNTWHHITLTWQAAEADGKLKIYLRIYKDGEYRTEATVEALTSGAQGGVSELVTGGDYEGYLDDLSIWNRVLENENGKDEIVKLMQGKMDIWSDLVGYWKFDEGEGTTVRDYSGSENDAEIVCDDPSAVWPPRRDVQTRRDGRAYHSWFGRDAVYVVECAAWGRTAEGLDVNGSALTTVEIKGGYPIAQIGGPYSCGIAGGDFSPIQFEGNRPTQKDLDTEGNEVQIDTWIWRFNKTLSHNEGIRFDGSDYVQVGSFDSSEIQSQLSLSAWLDTEYKGGIVVCDGYSLRVENGDLIFEFGNGTESCSVSTADPQDEADFSINDNRWHHAAGVYDGWEMRLYVDGILRASAPASGDIPSSGQVHIGKGFRGCIDEVTIWDKAIAKWHIDMLRRGRVPTDRSGLLGYWSFNEGIGAVTRNRVTNKEDGLSGNPQWVEPEIITVEDQWNPEQEYEMPGKYSVMLQVGTGKRAGKVRWSNVEETTVTVIDGSISGTIRAADLRTPVGKVRLTLTSPGVLDGDLSGLVRVSNDLKEDEDNNRGVYIESDVEGSYLFQGLPLGSYNIVPSKTEENGTRHKFEKPKEAVELTLRAPDRPAVDFIDHSVFPVGGLIRARKYDLEEVSDILIPDVVVEAIPLASTSSIRSTPSESTATIDRNYTIPLFVGDYVFFAELGGRDIRLDLDHLDAEGIPYEKIDPDNPAAGGIINVRAPTSDICFLDETRRELRVFVEDPGGFPVMYLDDKSIAATVARTGGGRATKAVEEENGTAVITYELPPAEYTLKVADDFLNKGITFRDPDDPEVLESDLVLDLTAADAEVTMVVPATIQLAFGPRPKLFGGPIQGEFKLALREDPFNLTDQQLDDLEEFQEGYMFYWPPAPQRHTYAIRATANDRPLEGYTLVVTDNVSQMTVDEATSQRISIPLLLKAAEDQYVGPCKAELEGLKDGDKLSETSIVRELFDDKGSIDLSDDAFVREASLDEVPGWIITDLEDETITTYYLRVETVDGNETLYADQGTYTVLGGLPWMDEQIPPKVKAKYVKFQAKKNAGYLPSEERSDGVSVLGDRAMGTAPELIAIPEINYLVLHDPPGDCSYAFMDDSLTMMGTISNMKIRAADGTSIPVYPSPWSDERGFTQSPWVDPIDRWIIPPTEDAQEAGDKFARESIFDGIIGAEIATLAGVAGPVGFALQAVFFDAEAESIGRDPITQYSIRPNRKLETMPTEEMLDVELPDLVGPGRGDIYYGEGITIGTQKKWRLGMKYEKYENDQWQWVPETKNIATYDILGRQNQYVYTARDIEKIIESLYEKEEEQEDETTKAKIRESRQKWAGHLEENLAYVWSEFYVGNATRCKKLEDKQGAGEELSSFEKYQFGQLETARDNIKSKNDDAFEAFREEMGLPEDNSDGVETLIFAGGTFFEYSRTISEDAIVSFAEEAAVTTGANLSGQMDLGWQTPDPLGVSPVKLENYLQTGASVSFDTSIQIQRGFESGQALEQRVGFILQDDDVGDSITTRVYEDPIYGTPLFIHDPGSVTSDPWEPGTNPGIDITMRTVPSRLDFCFSIGFDQGVVENLDSNIFPDSLADAFESKGISLPKPDVEVDEAGSRWYIKDDTVGGEWDYVVCRESNGTEVLNVYEAVVDEGPFDYHNGAHYKVKVTYTGARDLESDFTTFDFMLYAPQTENRDNLTVRFNGQNGAYETYKVGLTKEAPVANISISVYPPEVDQENWYEKQYSAIILAQEVKDAQINRQIPLKPRFADLRAPRAEIISPYQGQRIGRAMVGDTDDSAFEVQAISRDTDIGEIKMWCRSKRPDGVWGEPYSLENCVWKEGNTENPPLTLEGDPPYNRYTFKWTSRNIPGEGEYQIFATATDKANNKDLDPPKVDFIVDDTKPDVLTTIPNYQSKDSERIYRGELSVTFTDDMRADDFTWDSFHVQDLLEEIHVTGYISYSPALRKALFVPEVPLRLNGLYKVIIRTDSDESDGIHDLAGNPLKRDFSWTFRTTDALLEPTWSITLKAINTDGQENVLEVDANNIAGVEYGALDGEDEKDARSVPPIDTQMSLSFLNEYKDKFDRDIRPADGRLSHHWFFVVGNAKKGEVIIKYRTSDNLADNVPPYKIRLVEFEIDDSGNVVEEIPIPPLLPEEGKEQEAYSYDVDQDGDTRYFRLDMQNTNCGTFLVAARFQVGTSGWKFFSVPIKPVPEEPFVNLGDDISPFQMYKYDTETGGYKIYPLDLGEVALETGYGYFTRLHCDVEVDVGGSHNTGDEPPPVLKAKGWHAIGNPFPVEVDVSSLKVNGNWFGTDSANMLVENTLYRWKTDGSGDTYEAVDQFSQLLPWEGYWIKTKQDDVTLTIPAPDGLDDAYKALPDSYKPPVMAPPAADSRRIAIQPGEFDLRLELTSNFSADTTTTLGARQKARMDWDPMDQSEPPILGETVAAYFHHPDWGDDSGSYNRDYQPVLKVGEERTWRVTVYTDKPDSQMKLSWEESISQVPDDVMIYFRRADTAVDDDWQDMRKVRSMDLESRLQFTSISIEIRAQRYEMRPPSGVEAIPGEKLVTLRWEPDDNEFIDGYIITRQNGSAEDWRDGEGVSYTIPQATGGNVSEFADRDVLEEVTYTYQLSVRFMSGAELRSQLFTVRTLPVIKQTALMRCYPNPFNPEVWIPYDLAEEASVSVEIYSASGQLVRSLDLGVQQRGRYASRNKAAYWDGMTQFGERSASGVYFYVLKAGKFSASKKMVLIR